MEETHPLTEIKVSYSLCTNKDQTITTVTSSDEAARVVLEAFDKDSIGLQERFIVLYLNAGNRVLGFYTCCLGGITSTLADIRLILGTALKVAAVSIIVAHNHPSGNLKASSADKELTEKLYHAAKIMDIKLLDHLIFAPDGSYFSFADEGLL